MRKTISLIFLSLILKLVSVGAMAMPITPGDFGAAFEIFNPATSTVQYAYDDVTDTFSMNGDIGSVAQGAVLDNYPINPLAPVANDIVSVFSLTATVDDTGTFSGGSFSLIGSSATLGIGAGTTLLAGTLSSVDYFSGAFLPNFQIMSSVDIIDASIMAAFGPINSLLIDCNLCPPPIAFDMNPWQSGFGPSDPATQSPSIYGRYVAVAEPGILSILGIGLLGFVVARRWSSV